MDWPYEDAPEDAAGPAGAPTWDCPEDKCTCHKADVESKEYEVSVMLLSPVGERMKGAACRILYQGRVMNEDMPNANGDGWVTTKIPRVPSTILVEWAPAEKPKTKGYPYRRRYHVALSEDKRQAARRRLHNLGFSSKVSLEDNIKLFQHTYGYPAINGELSDIESDLTTYHDQGRPPSLKPAPEASVPAGNATDAHGDVPDLDKSPRRDDEVGAPHALKAKGGPDSKELAPPAQGGQAQAKAQPPPAPPPSKGGISVGVGTAKPGLLPPTVKTLVTNKEGLFEFVSLRTEWTNPKDSSKTMWGHFWIFRDALMWEVPNDAEWGFWGGTAEDQPVPATIYPDGTRIGVTNKNRLVRPQCTGTDATEAAKLLAYKQAHLVNCKPLKVSPGATPDANDAPVPCILPTVRLYNELYFNSTYKITPQNLPLEYMKKPMEGTLLYAEKVAKELAAKSAGVTVASGLATAVGTGGKIWALAKHMDEWWWCKTFQKWEFACINHGFHTGMKKAGNQTLAKAIQEPGGCHPLAHTDYSQIFVAVAGWCYVKDVDGTTGWKKTADVVTGKHGELWRLARSNSALKSAVYVGNIKNIAQPKGGAPAAQDGSPDDEQHA